ncbi:unnamed protein product, partial [Symbiodinium necroappetens]
SRLQSVSSKNLDVKIHSDLRGDPKRDPASAFAGSPSRTCSPDLGKAQCKAQSGSDSDSEGEEARKLYNRMEAKLREKGHSRTQLVKLMMEADGDRDAFHQKLKLYRKTEQFRNCSTKGGYYSESDMRKPVSEGGLAYKVEGEEDYEVLRRTWTDTVPFLQCSTVTVPLLVITLLRVNKYDTSETEYWVDYRTEGVRGVNECDGMEDTGAGRTDGFVAPALDDLPVHADPEQDDLPAGLHVEQGKKAELFSGLL